MTVSNFLSNLPEDLFSHVVQFLTPRDFYAVKTVTTSGMSPEQRDQINCYYWWREEVALTRAAIAACPSLVRWVVRNDPDLTADEVVHTTAFTRDRGAAVALHDSGLQRYPAAAAAMLEQWVTCGDIGMFHFQVERGAAAATPDVFDSIYLHSQWGMLALVFRHAPRAFIRWTFGDFIDVADPEVVTNLRWVLRYLDARDQLVLIRILNKYHDWLWRTKLDRTATLQTIVALHSLEVVPFQPERHLAQALASPQHDFLEYLLLRGLEVEPDMLRRTHDLKKMRLLMAAQVVQKYQKIMVMLLVLIVAVVLNVYTGKHSGWNTPPLSRAARVSKN